MAEEGTAETRTIGVRAATGIGVGGIVGGGILALAGVAFVESGPSAIIAFALNGIVALLTAASFAEISTTIPESGGAYTFAKKVLSVRAAFGAGWILWFAYIVAGVLYALGFAAFTSVALQNLWLSADATPPAWLAGRNMLLLLATLSTAAYAIQLIVKSTGGGQFATIGKVVLFALLIVAGVVAVARQPLSQTGDALTPFFSGGAGGLVSAMGFTFIALQGFDMIAAVAGEVREPVRTIPRAMFGSLGIAIAIYLPLLFVVTTAGVGPGETITDAAAASPETIIAVAARRFLGPVGFWMVIVAGILSMLSALQANLLSASRVALAMARDRTLPAVLGDLHATRRTPVMAVYASALTLVAITFMVPDLSAAGAAASLIFLISFALTHMMTVLARQRGSGEEGWRIKLFPLVPITGGVACAALAVFQALAVPDAGGIVLIWLGLGVILFWSLFARSAATLDATAQALDPRLARLRGRNPLVLVPVANPSRAPGMIEVANAIAPRKFGRVLLLSVVPVPDDTAPAEMSAQLEEAQRVVAQALSVSYAGGSTPEALITAAAAPMGEIERIASEHDCESLLLGIGDLSEAAAAARLERLMNEVECDVALLRVPEAWSLAGVRRVLVPVGGRGDSDELRARMLGSLCRTASREVTFITVMPANASDARVARAERAIRQMAELKVRGKATVNVVRSDDATAALLAEAATHDLVILGLPTAGLGRRTFGKFAVRFTHESRCATLLLSPRRTRAYEFIEGMREAVEPLEWVVRPGRAAKRE